MGGLFCLQTCCRSPDMNSYNSHNSTFIMHYHRTWYFAK